jgi:hypothetical protein
MHAHRASPVADSKHTQVEPRAAIPDSDFVSGPASSTQPEVNERDGVLRGGFAGCGGLEPAPAAVSSVGNGSLCREYADLAIGG